MEAVENLNDMWISLRFAMSYRPKNRKMSIKSRPQHTFVYIADGEYCYRFGKETLIAKSNDLVYVPKGATYTYEIVSETAYIRQVDFEINNPSFPFVDTPKIIDAVTNAENSLKEIIENFGTNNPKKLLSALGKLYEFCAFLPTKEPQFSDISSKIWPAVEYIEAHCAEKIDVQTLADLCFMSQAQLRRYFKHQYQMSPITYKNRSRIEKSKQMLLYGVADITNIAERLGFDSVYSFSKIFKMYAGITPSDFAKNKN
jgi:AraC-like DNA-binding protein